MQDAAEDNDDDGLDDEQSDGARCAVLNWISAFDNSGLGRDRCARHQRLGGSEGGEGHGCCHGAQGGMFVDEAGHYAWCCGALHSTASRKGRNVDWLVQGHIHKQERDFIGVDGSGVASHSKEHLNGWECSYLYMPRGGANLVVPI